MLVKQILMEKTSPEKTPMPQMCLDASKSMKHQSLIIKTSTLPACTSYAIYFPKSSYPLTEMSLILITFILYI